MKKYGEYNGVEYNLCNWCVYNLAYKYKIRLDIDDFEVIYVNSLKDLKKQINQKLAGE